MGTSGENVMELRVHLKVCEGCGCLWYRVQAETGDSKTSQKPEPETGAAGPEKPSFPPSLPSRPFSNTTSPCRARQIFSKSRAGHRYRLAPRLRWPTRPSRDLRHGWQFSPAVPIERRPPAPSPLGRELRHCRVAAPAPAPATGLGCAPHPPATPQAGAGCRPRAARSLGVLPKTH